MTAIKIRLAVCDDHAMFRQGVIASLRPFNNIEVVGEASNGNELLSLLPQAKPEVVLIDIRMPELDGIEVCKLIKRDHPHIHVIGLSQFEQVYFITGMFKAGAGSYLLKDVSPEEVANAVQRVYKEKYYLHDQIPVSLVKNLIKMEHPSVSWHVNEQDELKEREIELLRLITAELTNKEIATKLSLSPVTIENYRNQLLKKTGAKNTAGLVTYAVRKGYVLL